MEPLENNVNSIPTDSSIVGELSPSQVQIVLDDVEREFGPEAAAAIEREFRPEDETSVGTLLQAILCRIIKPYIIAGGSMGRFLENIGMMNGWTTNTIERLLQQLKEFDES